MGEGEISLNEVTNSIEIANKNDENEKQSLSIKPIGPYASNGYSATGKEENK